MRHQPTPGPRPVRIPADVDREDRILLGLSAHQLALLAAVAGVGYLGWVGLRAWVPPLAYVGAVGPFAVLALVVVVGRRDGIALDRWLAAGVRHRLSLRRRVDAPEDIAPVPAWIGDHTDSAAPGRRLGPAAEAVPAQGVVDDAGEAGVVDLGVDGCAVVAAVSTVNLAMRTPAEQDALVGTFGHYLHSLTGPVQFLIRTQPVDLSEQITRLRESAPSLPHQSLEDAAYEHADYLAELARTDDLLCRQVLLVLRELGGVTRRSVMGRLARRLDEAATLLAPAGITVHPLDPASAAAVLRAAFNPGASVDPVDDLAQPGATITGSTAAVTAVDTDGQGWNV